MTKTLKKGFTLVELIVVIAIIAILSTVSVVGYTAFIDNANQSKVNQELAQAENVLRAEAVETVTVSLSEGDPAPTLVMSLNGSKINFSFNDAQADDESNLLQALIIKVGLNTLEGTFALTTDGLTYTYKGVSASLDVSVARP